MFIWRERGLSYESIGKKLGISRQRVHQILSKAPVKKGVRNIDTSYLGVFVCPNCHKEFRRRRVLWEDIGLEVLAELKIKEDKIMNVENWKQAG